MSGDEVKRTEELSNGSSAEPQRKIRILIVDDELAQIKFVQKFVTDSPKRSPQKKLDGYTFMILPATSAQQARKIIEDKVKENDGKCPFEVVCSDHDMPFELGFSFLSSLLEKYPHFSWKLILRTSNDFEEFEGNPKIGKKDSKAPIIYMKKEPSKNFEEIAKILELVAIDREAPSIITQRNHRSSPLGEPIAQIFGRGSPTESLPRRSPSDSEGVSQKRRTFNRIPFERSPTHRPDVSTTPSPAAQHAPAAYSGTSSVVFKSSTTTSPKPRSPNPSLTPAKAHQVFPLNFIREIETAAFTPLPSSTQADPDSGTKKAENGTPKSPYVPAEAPAPATVPLTESNPATPSGCMAFFSACWSRFSSCGKKQTPPNP